MKKLFTFILTAAMVASMGVPALANEPVKAELSSAKVSVNGEAIAPQAYTIDGYTYFKLRDVAKALVGTEAGFDVAWDKAAQMINLTTGAAYAVPESAETVTRTSGEAVLSTSPILIDGEEATLTAYTVWGYNYFKLRDLGDALGFEVTWDKEARMIGINSAVIEVKEEPVVKEPVAEEPVAEEVAVESEVTEIEVPFSFPTYFENEVYTTPVVVTLPVDDFDISNEVGFTNCVFEQGLTIVGDMNAFVNIEGCTFGEGTGITVREYTEGNHVGMKLTSPFIKLMLTGTEGVAVTAKEAVVNCLSDSNFVLNGTEYSIADFGEGMEGFCVANYYEDGEAVVYTEAW